MSCSSSGASTTARGPGTGPISAGCSTRNEGGFLFAREGLTVIRPLMVGGATSMYCGCAAPPPPWLRERYGIDLEPYVSETVAELGVTPLPAPLRGPASTRLAEAARALGYGFEPQAKFVRPARARPFRCSSACMLGCRCGAKWTAAEYVDEAIAAGAVLRTRARVARVLVEDGHATGVIGILAGRPFRARAPTVVIAAGGLGTPAHPPCFGTRQGRQGPRDGHDGDRVRRRQGIRGTGSSRR